MKIVLDCFGCDCPEEVIAGAADALRSVEEVGLILCGDEDRIRERLRGGEFDSSRLEIVDAKEVIKNGEPPVAAIRTKKDSSLSAAYRVLRERGDAVAMISAGSTGAVLCGGMMLLGRCEGVERPALASLLPTDSGGSVCLTDCGANADCRPEHLLAFAKYASSYVSCACGVANPRVGLLSVGREEGKGNELTKAAYALLRDSGLRFVGNAEAGEVLSGAFDVIVTDGFSGNVLLKGIEGAARSVSKRMQALLRSHAPANAELSFVKSAFAELAESVDFNAKGGALLLGVRKIVIKAHGAATAETIVNTVKQALRLTAGGFDKILEGRL